MVSYGLYNALIGYLLGREEHRGVRQLAFFTVAIATHFVVNDHGLREHHKHRYHRLGRWILAAAVLAGWGAGALFPAMKGLFSVMFAFLAGAIVLNVLKEELPEERRSMFWPFALGAAAYSALLLLG